MLMLLALMFALPLAALVAAHVAAHVGAAPMLPTLDAFQLRALSVARARMHAFTGTIDHGIETRMVARLADELEARAPAPLPLLTRVRVALAWLHATSPVVRAVARPWRMARYHARTVLASACLALALLGSACGVVRALPTLAESRERTAHVLGAANATARMVLR